MVNSPDTGGVYAVAIILGVCALFAVVLRFIARRKQALRTQLPAWRIDDWLISIAMAFAWGLAIILIYGASVGTLGTHTRLNPETGAVIVTPHENQTSLFGGISQLLLVIALGFLKSGVVFFYRRIFNATPFKKLTIGVLIFILVWTVAFFFATVLECDGKNLDLLWKSIVTYKQQCGPYKYVQISHAVTDVVTDLVVLLLPLHEIWKLPMKTRQKITISLIFMVGILSTAAGIIRLAFVVSDVYETTAGARDVRGVRTNVMVRSYVEVGVGVVAACLPTLGPIANWRSLDNLSRSSTGTKLKQKTMAYRDHHAGPDDINNDTKIQRAVDVHEVCEEEGVRRDESLKIESESVE